MTDFRALLSTVEWSAVRGLRWLQPRLNWVIAVAAIAFASTVIALATALKVRNSAAEIRQLALYQQAQMLTQAPASDDSAAKLSEFFSALPNADQIPILIRDLLSLASRERVELSSAEYRVDNNERGHYQYYRIAVPVKGDIQAIQRFLLTSLNSHRTLGLESIVFKRESIQARTLEARIQFVFVSLPSGDTVQIAKRDVKQ